MGFAELGISSRRRCDQRGERLITFDISNYRILFSTPSPSLPVSSKPPLHTSLIMLCTRTVSGTRYGDRIRTKMQSNAFRLVPDRLFCKHPHCILNSTPRQPPCSPLDHPARTTVNGLDARCTPISRCCRSERLPTRIGDRCRAVRCRCHRRRCVVSEHAGRGDQLRRALTGLVLL
jgi:hypothetical protein